VDNSPDFPDLLRLIDERSAAFVAAAAAAPDLDARVPTCPDWTLSDLVRHLGTGRRAWAATVAAGPAATAKAAPRDASEPPREREALAAWLTASTRELLDALREAGPDRGCWTWWSTSQSPQTCRAVARHQLQEIAVHTYDAQLTAGAPRPLPDEVALDGAEEFLTTCCANTTPWPHQPAALDFHTTEGRSWRLDLSPSGARVTRLTGGAPEAPSPPTVSARGTAGDVVLVLYGRLPLTALHLEGDPTPFHLLRDWDPE
jgi:uncharacterized protein (TIGR03083 family)